MLSTTRVMFENHGSKWGSVKESILLSPRMCIQKTFFYIPYDMVHIDLTRKKRPFDQMALPNVEIMLPRDNTTAITITGMILLLLHHPLIQALQIIRTMLPINSRHVNIKVVQPILPEQFDV